MKSLSKVHKGQPAPVKNGGTRALFSDTTKQTWHFLKDAPLDSGPTELKQYQIVESEKSW